VSRGPFPAALAGQEPDMLYRWIWRTLALAVGRRLWTAWQRRRAARRTDGRVATAGARR
jgi:hypothetical protein